MYCVKCGNKIPAKGKFCPRCGRATDLETKEDAKKIPVKPRTSAPRRILGLFLLLIIVSFALVAISASEETEATEPLKIFLGVLFAGFSIWLFIEIVIVFVKSFLQTAISAKKLTHYLVKRPKVGLLLLTVPIVLLFILQLCLDDIKYRQINPNLSLVQDSLVEIWVAKSIGDTIVAGKTIPPGSSMKNVGTKAKTVSDQVSELKTPSRLKNYKLTIKVWADKIANLSEDQELWSGVGDNPGSFDLKLTSGQAEEVFELSLEKVIELKEFGDDAITRGDQETMRYIAAKLQVQDHWLQGVGSSTYPILSSGKISPVYAFETRRNPCLKNDRRVCLNDVTKILPRVYRSALGYTVGEPKAAEEWTNTWTEAAPIIQATGQPIDGPGITPGSKEETKYTPAVQAFFDGCAAKGGIVGGTGGVKARLPTTENGRTCWYEGRDCWDFLTYSGGHYMGGNAGCPEAGLIPPQVVAAPPKPTGSTKPTDPTTPTKTPKQPTSTSLNGVYSLTTSGSCNVPGFSHSGFSPISDNFTVRDNQIINPRGNNLPIDSSGRAQSNINASQAGFSFQIRETFIFSRSGGQEVTLSGNWSVNGTLSVEGETANLNCSGSFSGRRTSL